MLQLLIDHPQAIKALVAFEPAAFRLLPDAECERWITFEHEVYDLYRQSATRLWLDVLARKDERTPRTRKLCFNSVQEAIEKDRPRR